MPFVQYAQDRQTVCYMSKNSAGITFFDKSVKYFTVAPFYAWVAASSSV